MFSGPRHGSCVQISLIRAELSMGMADHHGRHATFRRILAAIDGSSISRHALREAVLLAKDQHACLRIVQVVDLAPLYEAEASGIDVSVAEQALLREAESE